MEYDDIFQYIGETGLYQVYIFVLLGLPSYFSGIMNLTPNFVNYVQEHWCYVKRLENYPHDWQKYVAVPYVNGDGGNYDSCKVYDIEYDNLTDQDIVQWNRSLVEAAGTPTRDCDAWVYDQSEFVSTIVSDVRKISLLNIQMMHKMIKNSTIFLSCTRK